MARKKKSPKKEPVGPQEYGGYSVGDEVFSYRFPDDKLSFGKITNIHLKDASGIPCFTFACAMSGQYRLSFFEKIIDEPTDKQKRTRDRMRLNACY